jgi:ElaB/YqjD/DUF883 family membrane-anchored ribosome-binding protein
MARAQQVNGYREMRDIRNDLNALKVDIAALSRHIQDDGIEKIMEVSDNVQDTARATADRVIAQGEDAIMQVEKQVKANPGRSVLMAFAGGLLLHALLGRK